MNHALEDVDRLVKQLIKVKEGQPLREALKTYEEEIWERGPKAVIGAIEDADRGNNLDELDKTRQANKGLSA